MPDIDALDARLRALERLCTADDAGADRPDLTALGETTGRLDAAEDRLDAVEDRLDALDAAVQSVRGYVGAVEEVNEEVERRADAALAVADRLDRRGDPAATGFAPDGARPSGSPPVGSAGPTGDGDTDGNAGGHAVGGTGRGTGETDPSARESDAGRGLLDRLRTRL